MHRQRDAAAARRKDAHLKDVIITERWDRKAAKYGTATVPFPFDSVETYERSTRQPLGRDFNTDASFRWVKLKPSGCQLQAVRHASAVFAHK